MSMDQANGGQDRAGTDDEPAQGAVGRVRVTDGEAVPAVGSSPADVEGPGWSLAGVGVAVLVILVMIGALLVILWGAFRLLPG